MKACSDIAKPNPHRGSPCRAIVTATGQALEEWIAAIKREEELASVNHSIAEVDKRQRAHFKPDEIRSNVKAAKKQCEDTLGEKFFGF